MNKKHDCIIIGSGPSGISLAAKLQKKGISTLILEKGAPAETWKKIPKHITLISPWWTNVLDLYGLIKDWPWKEIHAVKYYQYLKNFIHRHKLNIINDCNVKNVTRHNHEQYKVTTTKGVFYTPQVVCASGYYSSPAQPNPEFRTDDSIDIIHTADIQDFSEIPQGDASKKVLIVGKRTSAGQTLLAYHKKGYAVSVSTRSPITFRREGLYGKFRETLYFLYEPIWVRIKKGIKSNSYPSMDGGETRKLIENNTVTTKPIIKEIKNKTVYFENCESEGYDLIVLATGYRPSLSYVSGLVNISDKDGLPLIKNFQSLESPGIYFIGFDNIYDFRSRYLRGIRYDTKLLSKAIYLYSKESTASLALRLHSE